MSTPEPVAKPDTIKPTGSMLAATVGGMPLAVFTITLLNRTVFKSQPLGVEESVAIGAVGAQVFGYLFHVAKVLIDRAISRTPTQD